MVVIVIVEENLEYDLKLIIICIIDIFYLLLLNDIIDKEFFRNL